MNNADRFGLTTTKPFQATPPSPSASATKIANQLKAERQDDKSETRGEVTPAAIRKSMKPIRDIEFEYLKKFQTELFRSIVRAKENDLYHADFTLASRELDEFTMDFIFTKLIAVLRIQKFFVAVGTSTPRSFVVSWDPILTPDSITQEERDNPNSIASIRTRRFARLQKKNFEMAKDEKKAFQEFQEYLKIMKESPEQFRNTEEESAQKTAAAEHRPLYSIQVDDSAHARRSLMSNMLEAARFQQQLPHEGMFYGMMNEPEPQDDIKSEAINMIRAANEVVE